MDFHHKLRTETRFLHDQIEQSFLIKKIMSCQITREEYLLLLEKFYGFIAPCESLINELACKNLITGRSKSLLLAQDLQTLKMNKSIFFITSQCDHLPQLSEIEDVLGYLYVMEGSTLGGQIITKMLQKQLQISATHGGAVFYGYGNKTKAMWDDFCQNLNRVQDIAQQNKILLSARLTYNTLFQWMEKIPVHLDAMSFHISK